MKTIIRLKERFILDESNADVSTLINDTDTTPTSTTKTQAVDDATDNTTSGATDWATKIKTLSQRVALTSGTEKAKAESMLAETWKNFFESSAIFGKATNAIVERLGPAVKEECLALGFNKTTNPFLKFIDDVVLKQHLQLDLRQYGTIHNGYIDGKITKAMLAGNDTLQDKNVIRNKDFYAKNAADRQAYLSLQQKLNTNVRSQLLEQDDAIAILYNGSTLRPLDEANALFTEKMGSATEDDEDQIDIEQTLKTLSSNQRKNIQELNANLKTNFKLSDSAIKQIAQIILTNRGS